MAIDSKLLRKSVLALFAGQVSKLAIQAIYFVTLARMLGATDYGAFAAVLALAALLSPFSSLGTNTLMVRNVAHDATSAPYEWKRALLFTAVGGLFSSVLLAAASHWIAPTNVSWAVIFFVAVADLVGLRLVDLVGSFRQAVGSSRALAILPSVANLCRLSAAAAAILSLETMSLSTWSWVYAAATLPLGVGVAVMTTVKVGYYKGSTKVTQREVREGLLFATALASQNVYNDVDKAMLGRLVSATSAGIYSAAYRIIDMAYAPIRSVSAAAYPLYFREGKSGLRSALRLTRKISLIVLGYAFVGAIGVALVAPIAPAILGSDYNEAVQYIQMMAGLIILRAGSFLAADTLTGSGHQGYRTAVQASMAGINVCMNFYLLPQYGIGGAVISTLACEALLGALLWFYIVIQLRTTPAAVPRSKRRRRGRHRATSRV